MRRTDAKIDQGSDDRPCSFPANPCNYNAVMLRYNEIALKGSNRSHFEYLFIEGIKRVLREIRSLQFVRERGRVLAHLPHFSHFSPHQLNLLKEQLPSAFGLVSFSPGYRVKSTLESIEKQIDSVFLGHYSPIANSIANGDKIAYRMRARRSNKSFSLTSAELEIYFAKKLLPIYPRLKVDLERADLSVGVEVRDHWSFIFFNEFKGPGGLPSGSNSSALAMLSGGIDSPVASFLAMKRGVPLHFLTFHSHPYTPPESIIKVTRLARVLNRFQKNGKLFACNLMNAQKCIRDNCIEKYRTILYRRLMIRIATTLAGSLGLQALVTGESIGQVASQTIKNMEAINRATNMLVIRPLIGMDKQEIIGLARSIGTLTISEQNCPDSCTVFAPRSPTTGAKLARVMEEEERIDVPGLLKVCLSSIKLIDLKTYKEYSLNRGINSGSDQAPSVKLCDSFEDGR